MVFPVLYKMSFGFSRFYLSEGIGEGGYASMGNAGMRKYMETNMEIVDLRCMY